MRALILLMALAPATLRAAVGTNQPPTEWIDPDTGHRVIRLSTVPGSASLYFHQNSFTPKGDKFIFDAPNGITAVDLTKLGKGPVQLDLVVSRDEHRHAGNSRR